MSRRIVNQPVDRRAHSVYRERAFRGRSTVGFDRSVSHTPAMKNLTFSLEPENIDNRSEIWEVSIEKAEDYGHSFGYGESMRGDKVGG